jgi:hypothetical protein
VHERITAPLLPLLTTVIVFRPASTSPQPQAQKLRGPRTARHVERHQHPIPVATQRPECGQATGRTILSAAWATLHG